MTYTLDGKRNSFRRQVVEKDWPAYRKTTLTYAIQMDETFEVDTLEGVHTGKAGDYLACGPQGELYPIDKSIFLQSYEEAS